ncbi:MAG TPA: serine hydrolase domain-containing protein [Bryobacteraceae bacterium]|nr:serine hydrolase domain-containing protein [Bryobacteraceae bacterium]
MRSSIFALALCVPPAFGQLPAATQTAVDQSAIKILADTGVPSASVAIVKDGKIAYVHAYGDARLDPKTPALPRMRYKIASNSKQIAATAILLLAEEGQISLDDPVSRFLPALTRAGEVTIRELLSHTSGYEDYYPLDYVAPFMTGATTPPHILDVWAKKPLDFDPGTEWQYSNTNYVIIGQIIEKLTGKPLIDFLRARIFSPLGMHSPVDIGRDPWSDEDPAGYTTYALGPAREIPPEGTGWLYAAGELGMTAGDLALWDISLMNGTVLKPAFLRELTTEVRLKNGIGTHYALGLEVSTSGGHRRWAHSGGAAGFVSMNVTFPDDKISVTVLTNGEDGAASRIERDIEGRMLAPMEDPRTAPALENAKKIFAGLQKGNLERDLITGDLASYFTPRALEDFASSLGPLGAPSSFTQSASEERGGMTYRSYRVRLTSKSVGISTYVTHDGKFAQFLISPAANGQ